MSGTKGWTEESWRKIREGGRKGGALTAGHRDGCTCGWCTKALSEVSIEQMRQILHEHYASRSFEELGRYGRRKRVIEEQGDKCLRCNLGEWQGEPLTLEIDHVDANRANNERANLRALCPNCHSLTPTYGFRGRHHTLKARKSMGRDQRGV